MNTIDYRLAPSGDGPLAAEWTDKPHRLVYDLANAVDNLHAAISSVTDRLNELPQALADPILRTGIDALRRVARELDTSTSAKWQEHLGKQDYTVNHGGASDCQAYLDNYHRRAVPMEHFQSQARGAAAGMQALAEKPDEHANLNVIVGDDAKLFYKGSLATPTDRARMILSFLFPEQLDHLLNAAGIVPLDKHHDKVEQCLIALRANT